VAHRTTLAGFIAISALVAAACGSSATAAPTAAANGGGAASSAPGGGTGAAASGLDGLGQGALSSLLGGLGALNGGKDPSTLLTSDAAATILGGPVTAVPGAATPISASYQTTAGDTVTIFLESMPGTVTTALLQSALAQANANGDLTPISGLGDAAGKEVDDSSATVGFAKNGTLVIINAESSTQKGSDLEPKLETLAQQIVGQL
jgi:hypothetical protein